METKRENAHLQCRTCLVQLDIGTDKRVHHIDAAAHELRNWINNCTTILHQYDNNENETHYPPQICHGCYEAVRVANIFRMKVQQAERLLDTLNIESQAPSEFLACHICQRKYPQAIKSLICRVSDAPHLKQWLQWSGAQKTNSEWLTHAVCRFCYSKLRDCYEWQLAAKEAAEYLSMMYAQDAWHEYNGLTAFENIHMKQENFDSSAYMSNDESDMYFHQQLVDQLQPSTVLLTPKQEDYSATATYQECEYAAATPNVTNGYADSFDNTLLCLDVPYNVQKNFSCKSCYMSFSNSISFANHTRTCCTAAAANTSSSFSAITTTPHDDDTYSSSHSYQSRNSSRESVKQSCVSKKVCNQCSKRFNKPILLEAHILQVHEGKSKPFLCKYCSHAYITHSHLKRHLASAHKRQWLKNMLDDENSQQSFLDL